MTRSVYVAVSLVLFVFSVTSVSGRGFTRCDLAHELLEQGFPMEDLRDCEYISYFMYCTVFLSVGNVHSKL